MLSDCEMRDQTVTNGCPSLFLAERIRCILFGIRNPFVCLFLAYVPVHTVFTALTVKQNNAAVPQIWLLP